MWNAIYILQFQKSLTKECDIIFFVLQLILQKTPKNIKTNELNQPKSQIKQQQKPKTTNQTKPENKEQKNPPKTSATSVAVHYSMNIYGRKLSAWAGIHTNAFRNLRLSQHYFSLEVVSLKNLFSFICFSFLKFI